MLPTSRDLSQTYEAVEFVVREVAKDRLDRYLQVQLAWKSRSKVQKLIQLGRVTVNGICPKPATRVQRGDSIRIQLDSGVTSNSAEDELAPPVWEDSHFLAINKPPHRLVHPVGRTISGTIINELHRRYRSVNQRGLRPVVPKLCHRLDRETSGMLLVAKTDFARSALSEAFEHGQVAKQYLAIIGGNPESDTFHVDIGVSADLDPYREQANRLAKADPDGKPAHTAFRVLARENAFSVVACFPYTGRQNQIRIHLAHAGYPILGDWGYGSSREEWQHPTIPYPERSLLHSLRLRFSHPQWNIPTTLLAPPPPDFTVFTDEALGVEAAWQAADPLFERSDSQA